MMKKLAIILAAFTTFAVYADDMADIRAEIAKRHDEAVKRLQDWIALPSIAAENRNYPAGAEYMAKLAREAGFQQATVLSTDGKPGVFATLDAGAKKTVGLYFMYDVKQFDPAEWTSPPLEARLVDKPGVAPHQGPRHARLRRRQHHHHRQLSQAAADQRGREGDDRPGLEAAQRGTVEEVARRAALDRRPAVGAGQRAPRVAADGEHR